MSSWANLTLILSQEILILPIFHERFSRKKSRILHNSKLNPKLWLSFKVLLRFALHIEFYFQTYLHNSNHLTACRSKLQNYEWMNKPTYCRSNERWKRNNRRTRKRERNSVRDSVCGYILQWADALLVVRVSIPYSFSAEKKNANVKSCEIAAQNMVSWIFRAVSHNWGAIGGMIVNWIAIKTSVLSARLACICWRNIRNKKKHSLLREPGHFARCAPQERIWIRRISANVWQMYFRSKHKSKYIRVAIDSCYCCCLIFVVIREVFAKWNAIE